MERYALRAGRLNDWRRCPKLVDFAISTTAALAAFVGLMVAEKECR
jgi:hypothetical protein